MNSNGVVSSSSSWRRAAEDVSPEPSTPFVAEETSLNSDSREKVVRLVMGSLSLIDWARGQWLLWLFFVSIGAAYYRPVPVALDSNVWARILVLFSFTLSGASFPDMDRNAAARFVGVTITTGMWSLVISPILGIAIYLNMQSESSDVDGLFIGLMCAMCLPPSGILSVAATRSAQGSEALAQYLSSIGSICGVIASPLLMVACVSLSHSARLPNPMDGLLFPVTVIGPFFTGVVAQRTFAWVSHRRITGEDREGTARVSNAQLACSELCDGSLIYWRQRAIQLNCLVMLVLNYLMFSSFFIQASAPTLLTWRGVGIVAFLELGLYAATCVLSWLVTSFVIDVPEERVALFFVLITKSEVLAIPIILYLFGDRRQAAVILLPSLLYHLIQAFATAVLSFPVRRWRYRYNCRPGTTLLPLRLSKTGKAALGKASF